MIKYPTTAIDARRIIGEVLGEHLLKAKIKPSQLATNITVLDPIGDKKGLGAKKTDISRILNYDKVSDNSQRVPNLLTLFAICNYLQCDINYLFGTYTQPTKEVTDVFDYTGLPAEMIDALNQRMERDKRSLDAYNQTFNENKPIDVLMVQPFFLRLILSTNASKLFMDINDASLLQKRIQEIRSKTRLYKIVKAAFDKALDETGVIKGYLELGIRQLQEKHDDVFEQFLWVLTEMEGTFDTTVEFWNGWARKRFGMNIRPLFDVLSAEYQFPQRERIIESEFMQIVQEFFKGGAE